ncbi:MAG: hypothetical protein QMD25_01380 [Caldisericia bacterium]|jgi:hypothetical protein|nr:hypothetical protein [Caldisericia bacterium]
MKKFLIFSIIFILLFSINILTVSANNLREVKFIPVNPQVDNLINNNNANWEILIDNTGGNLLISGDRIYIEFPSGFDLTYSNFVSLIPITASGISATGSGVIIGGSQIIIPITSNQTSLGSFKVRIGGVRNPSTPSGTYMGRVWTTTSTGIILDGPTYSQSILIVSATQPPQSTISKVEIIPNLVNLNVGSSQLFIARAYDIYGNILTNVNFYWSVLPGTGNGIINQNGYFTLTSFGSVTIKCEVLGTNIFGLAYVNSYYTYPYPYYPYYISNLIITPNNVNLSQGATQIFSAQAFDSLGNPIPNLTYIWTVFPISSGTFTVSPDTKNLSFTLGSYYGVVTIKCEVLGTNVYNFAYINSIQPNFIDKIIITPSNVYLSYSNPIQTFKAVAYDSSGNVLSGVTFSWSLNPSVAGNLTISSSDTSLATFYLNSSFSGTAIVSCSTSYGSPPKIIYGYATISTIQQPYPPYYPYINTIVITPQTTTMSVGETKIFTAQAYNNFGNPIYGLTYNWTIISGSGFITPSSDSSTIYFTLTGGTSVTLKCEVISLGLTGYAYINSYVPLTPPIYGVNVSVYPPIAGYIASYIISFNISSYSLNLGDYILLTFPNDTYLPSFISPQYITINGIQLNSYPIIYLSSRSILLYLPTNVPPNGRVDIAISYFANIRNPSSPGNYTLIVTTNKTPNPTISNPYSIQ